MHDFSPEPEAFVALAAWMRQNPGSLHYRYRLLDRCPFRGSAFYRQWCRDHRDRF